MPISKDEIQKYIFDPQNPQQCKSYKLLLRTAMKEHRTFLSPNFVQYFFEDEILDDDFKNELWDTIPEDYEKMDFFQKQALYQEQFSPSDFKEFVQNKMTGNDFSKLNQYSFMNNCIRIGQRKGRESELLVLSQEDLKTYFAFAMFKNDVDFLRNTSFLHQEYDQSYILFSNDYLDILYADIQRASVIVTLEKNIDRYLEYDNNNVKPLFIKKMEDVDLLLNVLNNDTKNGRQTNKKHIHPKETTALLDKVTISQFYSLKEVALNNLGDKKEIYLVGENGDGKTLLLQSIALALKGVTEGEVFDLAKSQKDYKTSVVFSDGAKLNKADLADESNPYPPLLAYGAHRNGICGNTKDELGYLTLFANDIDLYDPKEWLTYLDYKQSKNEPTIISVEGAKELLKHLLEKEIEITITTEKITFTEKGSEVSFEQLSAGYKGVITIICDMIKRFSELQTFVEDIGGFQGVVLIDEVELHLHPKWKYNFMKKLRDTFPLVQFIVTTHSPTVLLGAGKEAVFYKVFKEEGEVKISEQILNRGFTTNSLVSSPIFDLETVASRDLDVSHINDDDYIYSKIHQVIAKKIKDEKIFDDEHIIKLIEEELDKI